MHRLIDTELQGKEPNVFNWKSYGTFDEINSWLDEKLKEHPTLLTNQIIGTTYNKRPIRVIKLSAKPVRTVQFTLFLISKI